MSGIHGIRCHDPLRGQEPGTREAVGSEGPMPEHYSVHNLFNSEEGGDDILFGADSGDIFFRGSGSGIIARYPDDAAMGGAGGSGPSFGADTAFDALFSHDGSMHDIELLILDGGDKEDTPFITSLTDLAKMSLATDNSPLPR